MKILNEKDIYLTLIGKLLQNLVKENIITKYQRTQIHDYLLKTIENNEKQNTNATKHHQ